MKKQYIYGAFFTAAMSLTSCLDYDVSGDEFNSTSKNVEVVTNRGLVDSIAYRTETNVEATTAALESIADYLAVGIGGQFAMRGGKQGENPGTHAYQFQYSLGADNYAQYAVIPHTWFEYAKFNITSTYNIVPGATGGAKGSFNEVNKCFVPILNTPKIDRAPEMKAAYLLLYNYAALEVTDIYGPMPYREYKTNLQVPPYTYNTVEDIYNDVIANIDTALACFHYFAEKPDDYKTYMAQQFRRRFLVMTNGGVKNNTMDGWIRFANSLKLRIAMHLAKIDPDRAKTMAEAAVKDGVIESEDDQVALRGMRLGFSHPLPGVADWGDTRMSASMEVVLNAFNHPYINNDFLWLKNSQPLTNESTGKILGANSRVCGIRSGTHPGKGQGYESNQYVAFSRINTQYFWNAPLYLMKYAEVCFLRAEGAVRGWDMQGNAKDFYEAGIRAGNFEDVDGKNNDNPDGLNFYDAAMDEYLALENAIPYTYVDPTGETPDVASPITIGVKWNDSDDREVKLEKIITQKYIANFPNSFETWVDMRRTGYPRLLPVLNVDEADGSLLPGDLIRRLPFPGTDDIATKMDVDATGIGALGGEDKVGTRLWWDVNTSNFQ